MIIAQISDTHILARSSTDPAGSRRAADLRRCIADINRQGADVVVHTGDSVHQGQAEEYAHLREILAELEAPVFLVPGNRDRRDTLRAAFDHLSHLPAGDEFLLYAVDDFPIRLVALDSVATGERKGVFCGRRRVWLEETLGQERDWPTILFIHHPPFDIPQHRYMGGYRDQQDADDLAAVVSRHSQVKHLLCGHVHCLHRESWAGATATVMPSVAVDLRIKTATATDRVASYLLHTVSSGGDVVTRTQVVTR